jgi:predicted RNA-binding protein with PUA-like domain
MVDVKFVRACKKIIPLDFLKKVPGLKNMALFKYSRLSVQPVTEAEWKIITRLIDKQDLK